LGRWIKIKFKNYISSEFGNTDDNAASVQILEVIGEVNLPLLREIIQMKKQHNKLKMKLYYFKIFILK
jgi:hypothetical protein